LVAHALSSGGADASEDGTGRGTPLVPVAFDLYNQQVDGQVAVAFQPRFYTRDTRSYVAQMSVRRLTPRECERLQGYPDDWTLVPYRGKPASDGPRYRAIGNGWAVPVVAWIFRRLDLVEDAR
jgi:DNA (cytosine-5)-methyltransferase 1